jgi:hypothetical protein
VARKTWLRITRWCEIVISSYANTPTVSELFLLRQLRANVSRRYGALSSRLVGVQVGSTRNEIHAKASSFRAN